MNNPKVKTARDAMKMGTKTKTLDVGLCIEILVAPTFCIKRAEHQHYKHCHRETANELLIKGRS